MSKVKNQHYVPQSYLRRFANDHEQFWAFDKVTRRSYSTKIRNAASESRFYDFDAEDLQQIAERVASAPASELSPDIRCILLDPQLVEHALSEMEDGFIRTLDEVIHTIDITRGFTEDQKRRLAYFIAMQMLRGPEFRKTHLERTEKIMDATAQMLIAMQFGNHAVGSLRVSLDKKHVAYGHARMMFDKDVVGTYTGILAAYIWHVGIAPKENMLYTSDTPVVMRSHLDQAAYGIGSPSVEIMFPLSSRYVLVLHERQYFAAYQFMDCQTKLLTSENIKYFNCFQVLRSYRHVYCEVSDFELGVNICATNPEICDPDRDRIQVHGGAQHLLEKNAQRRSGNIM